MTAVAAGWDAPPGVRAFTTSRVGGTSLGPYSSLNLGDHVGDEPRFVAQNRLLVQQSEGWDRSPLWLEQTHSSTVVVAESLPAGTLRPKADGAVTSEAGLPLVILTADCLPVLACDRGATVIGAFHAGWKGLLAGILETGLAAMKRPFDDLLVWIGPSIARASYQVGAEVREAFVKSDPEHESDFAPDGPGRWRFDLTGAAKRRLFKAGVASVANSPWDTLANEDLFFSHRRQTLAGGEAATGRMGTFICLEKRSSL